jgi:thiol-disulfide isomerase/thioredoxin
MNHRSRLALAAWLLAGSGLPGCRGKEQAPPGDVELAPELKLSTLEGERFDLRAHRGEVVLLNLWATWCQPCRQELPELARLHREHQGRQFTVAGVNVDVARLEPRVRSMVADFELPFPVLLDPNNESVPKFEVVGYPTTFVIARDGSIRWRRDGIIFENDEELAGVLESALSD